MANNKQQTPFHRELLAQLVTLSTSAFGLAAALAWNDTPAVPSSLQMGN